MLESTKWKKNTPAFIQLWKVESEKTDNYTGKCENSCNFSSFIYSSSEDQVDSTSVTSHASSSCPLGLPLPERKSSFVNEDGVVLRKNSSKYSADSSQKSSITTVAAEESPKIQRLAKSGLYINPSDALKFFSTQVNFHHFVPNYIFIFYAEIIFTFEPSQELFSFTICLKIDGSMCDDAI